VALPTDRVQVIKQESTALGGDDADAVEWGSSPIEPQEDAIEAAGLYLQDASNRDEAALIWREGDTIRAKDVSYGTVDLLAAATGGITAPQHQALLQLIHFLDEGPAKGFVSGATKTVTGTVFPTQTLWKRQDGTKLVEKNITWTGVNPTTIEWELYAADGSTVLETVTDTISYSGIFETGRTRAIT
jgi:hypothetical protein